MKDSSELDIFELLFSTSVMQDTICWCFSVTLVRTRSSMASLSATNPSDLARTDSVFSLEASTASECSLAETWMFLSTESTSHLRVWNSARWWARFASNSFLVLEVKSSKR